MQLLLIAATNRCCQRKKGVTYLPDEVLAILESGEMTQNQYIKILNYYNRKGCLNDWFGSYGIDGGGHYYHYIIGYQSKNEKTYKVYLKD